MQSINTNTITLLILIILSFSFSGLIHARLGKHSILSGIEFLILGIILGPNLGLGFIDSNQLKTFSPLISLLIGSFGLFFGLELIKLKTFRKSNLISGMWIFTTLFFITTIISYAVLYFLFPDFSLTYQNFIFEKSLEIFNYKTKWIFSLGHFLPALCVGAIMSISSTFILEKTIQSLGAKGPISDFIPNLVVSGEVLGIFIFGTAFAASRAAISSSSLGLTITEWSLAVIGIGVFCGFLFQLFVAENDAPIKIYLSALAVVTFTTGVAYSIGISALYLNFICGIIIALTNKHTNEILEQLKPLRGPFTVMILFFAGTTLDTVPYLHYILVLIYIILRLILLKWIPHVFLGHQYKNNFLVSVGRCFKFQDILIVVIGMDLSKRNITFASPILLLSIISYVLFSFLSLSEIKNFLIDVGELNDKKN